MIRFYMLLLLLSLTMATAVTSSISAQTMPDLDNQPTSDSSLEDEKNLQDLINKENMERIFSQVLKFHSDWRKYRKPLSAVKRSAFTHRELVLNDIVFRLYYPDYKTGNTRIANPRKYKIDPKIFDEVVRKNLSRFSTKENSNIILSSNNDLQVGHPDCETDYQCMCSTEHTYNAIRMSSINTVLPHLRSNISEIVGKIKNIEQGKLLNCYEMINHHEAFQKQNYCRFLTSVKKSNSVDGIRIIGNKGFVEGQVKNLILENSIRIIPESRLPLGRASKFVRPIYAEIDGEPYVFEEVYSDPGVRCALTKLFENPVADLSQCEKPSQCGGKAASVFARAIIREMGQAPLLASRDESSVGLPGEIILKRNYKRSEVLGAPYYESSQYLLRWYRNSLGKIGPPGSYTYSKGNSDHEGSYLYFRIHQSLSIRASKNGNYPEGSSQQYAAYEEAIAKAIRTASSKACIELNGVLNTSNICLVN